MPAQRLITQAEYIAMTDYLAQMVEVLLTAKGVEDTPATAAAYAAACRNQITAFDQPDEADITVDLLPSTISLVAAVERESEVASLCAGFNAAVTSHLGQDLNAWLTSAGLRVHHYFRRGGNTSISPINVCPPVTVLGTVSTTGQATCSLTKDPVTNGLINTALYADAQLEVEVISGAWGSSAATFTIVGLDFAGQAQSTEVIVPGDSLLGATVDVGTAADRFARVNTVTCAGGQAGDDMRIQSKLDR